ncbi:MAG: DNA-3-methyladenine glycosylase family protein [Candidatus Promineifilaceae bacterium]|jgi:3-methyladenine DNA glycosylase/8-oxoguanine DNA glycosylase
MEFTLDVQPPFSLQSILHSHGWIQLASFVSDAPYQEFNYTHQLNNNRVTAWHVRQEGSALLVNTDGQINGAEKAEISEKLAWMLDLDRDLSNFYAVAHQEPKLAHVVDKAAGRILRSASFFEDTVKTILTTNTSWSGTKRMVQTLVDLYGRPLPGDPARRAFPTPEQLAEVDMEALRLQAKLGYRAPYVSELARRVASGDLDLETYKSSTLPTQALRKELLAIKGIGTYAAANLLMLLGRTDYIPIDSYALKVVSEEFHDGVPVKPADVEAAFERFGEWKGMAFWFWDYAN